MDQELFAADRNQVDSRGGLGQDACVIVVRLLLCVYPALFCPCSFEALLVAVNWGFGAKILFALL